jgi:acetyl-CoA acetyltransferase
MMSAREPVIVGVYLTQQARSLPGRTSLDLVIEAAKGAIADAGLAPRDVDGVALEWPGPGGAPGASENWAAYFHQPLRWVGSEPLDMAGVRGVLKAASAIQTGLCDVAIVGSGRAAPLMAKGVVVGAGMDMEFADCFGSSVMAQFALIARRHMHEFGTTNSQMARVAATIRNYGHRNPEAVMFGKGPYGIDDVLASPMVASPFHRLDCCLVNEGGCALVITTAERARDLRRPPIRLLGGGMEFWRGNYANPPLYRELRRLGLDAVARAFGKAGVCPKDMDLFCLYDPVSFEIIRQLEMLGLCAEGEGGPLVESGAIDPGGAYPVNPDGGQLAGSWTGTGQLTLKVIESVRQLRGDCGERQIANAKLAVATNAGSGAQHIEIAVLGRD